MSQFRYKALDTSRSIRLLQFLKGPKPVCNMITVEVEKAPPYVALSYTWGEKMLSNQIQVNGQMIPITANLGDAVGAIYEYARERNMMLWADSICINQADIQERSQQVRLMNTIYRSAEIVAIWLGAAADE
ncbi:HET-domain-containing protein, partial [Periconia macrospinosa]